MGQLSEYINQVVPKADNSSRRGVTTKHYLNNEFRRCPVCQHAIEYDHQEALVLQDQKEAQA